MTDNPETPPVDPSADPAAHATDPANAAEPAAAKVQETITTGLGHFFQAMEKGAASVYHRIIAAEQIVVQWEQNPAVGALVDEGVSLGTAFLSAHGIPVASLALAGQAVFASLKAMAAADTSVSSTAKS